MSYLPATKEETGLKADGSFRLVFDIETLPLAKRPEAGAVLTIDYSTFETVFGFCLTASTSRGICNILFADDVNAALRDLESRWPSEEIRNERRPEHGQIQEFLKGNLLNGEIRIHLLGTSFQIKVWKSLLSISAGTTSSYGQVAQELGNRKLSRAVGM
ncbi:MAG TPA: MGMT family protein, partial [Candidatus Paceibacterota bacterium]|nr:MGMT family protein [Candidatus Paceibacterota bacterium]